MMNVNGCSTCENGKQKYEIFYSRTLKKYMCQYEYRTPDGKLFTCVSQSLKQAVEKRNIWLERQKELIQCG